jgi:uncharacterized protein with HEPN domain
MATTVAIVKGKNGKDLNEVRHRMKELFSLVGPASKIIPLIIIGEATKNLSVNLRKTHPKVPWKDLMGMRDKMIHHYFGINHEIVWTIAKEELAGLLPQVERILAK